MTVTNPIQVSSQNQVLSQPKTDNLDSGVIQNSPLKGRIKRLESAGLPFVRPPLPKLGQNNRDYAPTIEFVQTSYDELPQPSAPPLNAYDGDNSWMNENSENGGSPPDRTQQQSGSKRELKNYKPEEIRVSQETKQNTETSFRAVQQFARTTKSRLGQRTGMPELPTGEDVRAQAGKRSATVRANIKQAKLNRLTKEKPRPWKERFGLENNSPFARMDQTALPRSFRKTFFTKRMREKGFVANYDPPEDSTLQEKWEFFKQKLADVKGQETRTERGYFALSLARTKAQGTSLKQIQNEEKKLRKQRNMRPGVKLEELALKPEDELKPLGFERRYVSSDSKGERVHTDENGKKYVLWKTGNREYHEWYAQRANESAAFRNKTMRITPEGIEAGVKDLEHFLDPKNDPGEHFQSESERKQIIQDFRNWCEEYNTEIDTRIEQFDARQRMMSRNIFQELGMPLVTGRSEQTVELREKLANEAADGYVENVLNPKSWKEKLKTGLAHLSAAFFGVGLLFKSVRRRVLSSYVDETMRQVGDRAYSLTNPEVLAQLRSWNKASAQEWVARQYAYTLEDHQSAHNEKIYDPQGLFAAFGNFTREELIADIKSQLLVSESVMGEDIDDAYLQAMAEGIFEGMSEALYEAAQTQLEIRAIASATDDVNSWAKVRTDQLRNDCEQAWKLAEEQVDFGTTLLSRKSDFEGRFESLERNRNELTTELGRYSDGVLRAGERLKENEEPTRLERDLFMDENDKRLKSTREALDVADRELEAARASGQLVHDILGSSTESNSIKGIQQEIIDELEDFVGKDPQNTAEDRLQRVNDLRVKLDENEHKLTDVQYDRISEALDELEERITDIRDWQTGNLKFRRQIAEAGSLLELDEIRLFSKSSTRGTLNRLAITDLQDAGRFTEVSELLDMQQQWLEDQITGTRDMLVAFGAGGKKVDNLRDRLQNKELSLREAMSEFDKAVNILRELEDGHDVQFSNLPGLGEKFHGDLQSFEERRAELIGASLGISNPERLSEETVERLSLLHQSGVMTNDFAEALRANVKYRAKTSNEDPSAKHVDEQLAGLKLHTIMPDLSDLDDFLSGSRENVEPTSTNPFEVDLRNESSQQTVENERTAPPSNTRSQQVKENIRSVLEFTGQLYPDRLSSQLKVARDILRATGLNEEELAAFTQAQHAKHIVVELQNAIANEDLGKAFDALNIDRPNSNDPTEAVEYLLDSVEQLAKNYKTYFARVGGGDLENSLKDLRAVVKGDEQLTEEQINRARSLALTLSTLNPDVEKNTEVRLRRDVKLARTLQERLIGDFGLENREESLKSNTTMMEAANSVIVSKDNVKELASVDGKMKSLKSLITVQQESASLVEGAILEPLREFGKYLTNDLKDPKTATPEEIRGVMESEKFRKKARVLGQIAGLFDAKSIALRKELNDQTDSDIYASKLRAMNELSDRLLHFDPQSMKARGFEWLNSKQRELYQTPPEEVMQQLTENGGKQMADDFANVWKHLTMLNAISQSNDDIQDGLKQLTTKRDQLLSSVQKHRSNQLVQLAILEEFADSGKTLDEFDLKSSQNNVKQRLQSWGHESAWDTFAQDNSKVLDGLTEETLFQWQATAGELPEELQKQLTEFDNQMSALRDLVRSAGETSQSFSGTVLDPTRLEQVDLNQQSEELEQNLQVVGNTNASRAVMQLIQPLASWHQHSQWSSVGGEKQEKLLEMSLSEFTRHVGDRLLKLAPEESGKRRQKAEGLRTALNTLQQFDQKSRQVKELILCGLVPSRKTIVEMENLAKELKKQGKSIKPGLTDQFRLKKSKTTDDKELLDLIANRLSSDIDNFVSTQLNLVKTFAMRHIE